MLNWITGIKRWLYIAGAVVVAVFIAWFQYLRREVKEQQVKLDDVETRNNQLKLDIEEAVKVTEVKQEIKNAEDATDMLSDDDVTQQLLDKYTRNKD
jgi:DNA-binding transcriptional regulator GbsR (MarR family)